MESFDELLANVYSLMAAGDLKSALIKAKEAVRRNRLNLTANLLLATILFQQKNWLESFRYYRILLSLQQNYKEEIMDHAELEKIVQSVWNQAIRFVDMLPSEKAAEYKEQLFEAKVSGEGIARHIYYERGELPGLIGEHTIEGKRYYFARYADHTGSFFRDYENVMLGKICIMEVGKKGKEYVIEDALPCVLPVVTNLDRGANDVYIETKDGKSGWPETVKQTFSYWRIQEPMRIFAQKDMIFGKPIYLKTEKKQKKKLVLNIFLDTFHWYFFKEHSFQELMPHTYNFFRDGVICERFYTGSEFTYPSVASYWTGLRPMNHKLLNQDVSFPFLQEHRLLPEVFQEQGYYVSKIGGNDAASPDYGYLRGVDRFVFGRAEANFNVQESVYEAIEQLEALPELSHFMLLEVQDLHEVGGYWPTSVSVQSNVDIQTNVCDHQYPSTIYQTPSANRRAVYKEQLKRVDRHLNALYTYVKEHYSKDEVIVTFFSDHGMMSYSTDENQPMMSNQRTNVPLMIYGCDTEEHICNEKIETIDYGHILCKLVGIEDDWLKQSEGQLPVFFGGDKEKAHVFSQSLYPNRRYEAAILCDEFKFYFSSEKLVGNDCRIDISSGSYSLVDGNDEVIEDAQLADECLKVMMTYLGDYLLLVNEEE